MADRTELLESALDRIAEGVALSDSEGRVAFWNHAAETITGHGSGEVVGRGVRKILDDVVAGGSKHWVRLTDAEGATEHGSLVQVHHKLGHEVPVLARVLVLRDGMGARIGLGVLFHPAENLDALPRGQRSEELSDEESQMRFEERLSAMHEDSLRSDIPLGVIWVAVDQAQGLRRTHGLRAVEAMLEKIQRTLAAGLKPAEEIGLWGGDEFLVLSHERNAAMLAAHAQVLAGMARTTDFRWWGDRISLTVSVGGAQSLPGEGLGELLERAQSAMLTSIHGGGNRVTILQGRSSCSRS